MTQRDKEIDWQTYLVEILKEDVRSREAELSTIRSSLRYRLGGWVLEAWPPGPRTFVIAAKLLIVLFRRRRNAKRTVATPQPAISALKMPVSGTETIVYGKRVPSGLSESQVFCSDHVASVVCLLDEGNVSGTLVVRVPHQAIARRIERIRDAGWRVIWWPEKELASEEMPLVSYLLARSDECRPMENA